MLSVAKLVLIFLGCLLSWSTQAKDLFIVVIGQSISANCNENIYGEVDGVYQVDERGERVPAKDPFIWADCNKGSMWVPLGERLIKSGVASTVTFMPIGVAGTSVRDWRKGGRSHEKFLNAYKLISQKNIMVDYIFWHQGSADSRMNSGEYRKNLVAFLKKARVKINADKVLVAQHSRCGREYAVNIADEQEKIGTLHNNRFYPGANNNQLGDEYRFDGCHLNKMGQEKMADLWLDSILEAEKIESHYDEETLLKFFRW